MLDKIRAVDSSLAAAARESLLRVRGYCCKQAPASVPFLQLPPPKRMRREGRRTTPVPPRPCRCMKCAQCKCRSLMGKTYRARFPTGIIGPCPQRCSQHLPAAGLRDTKLSVSVFHADEGRGPRTKHQGTRPHLVPPCSLRRHPPASGPKPSRTKTGYARSRTSANDVQRAPAAGDPATLWTPGPARSTSLLVVYLHVRRRVGEEARRRWRR